MAKIVEKQPIINWGDTIHDKYKIFNCLGQGGFGAVYEIYNMENEEIYALKIELVRPNSTEPGIALEISALKKLQHNCHVPRFIDHDQYGKYNFMVMQLVGRNLGELRRSCPQNSFTLSTSIRISLTCLEIVEVIHASGYLHRDIKPTNFTIGATPNDLRTVYILDFGLVRKFRTNDGKIRNARPVVGFRGTIKYASLNAHKNLDLGRIDDLWSWYYMVIEFVKGELPWRSERDRAKVTQMKETGKNDLLKNVQPEITKIFDTLDKLKYPDEPNYHLLKNVFNDILQRRNFAYFDPYDWESGGAFYDASKTPTVNSIKKKKKKMAATAEKQKKTKTKTKTETKKIISPSKRSEPEESEISEEDTTEGSISR